jgi:hypothetical protein
MESKNVDVKTVLNFFISFYLQNISRWRKGRKINGLRRLKKIKNCGLDKMTKKKVFFPEIAL